MTFPDGVSFHTPTPAFGGGNFIPNGNNGLSSLKSFQDYLKPLPLPPLQTAPKPQPVREGLAPWIPQDAKDPTLEQKAPIYKASLWQTVTKPFSFIFKPGLALDFKYFRIKVGQSTSVKLENRDGVTQRTTKTYRDYEIRLPKAFTLLIAGGSFIKPLTNAIGKAHAVFGRTPEEKAQIRKFWDSFAPLLSASLATSIALHQTEHKIKFMLPKKGTWAEKMRDLRVSFTIDTKRKDIVNGLGYIGTCQSYALTYGTDLATFGNNQSPHLSGGIKTYTRVGKKSADGVKNWKVLQSNKVLRTFAQGSAWLMGAMEVEASGKVSIPNLTILNALTREFNKIPSFKDQVIAQV